jgi:hypothetical protein
MRRPLHTVTTVYSCIVVQHQPQGQCRIFPALHDPPSNAFNPLKYIDLICAAVLLSVMAQATATVLSNVAAGAASLLSQQKQPSCHKSHSQTINLFCHLKAASSVSSAMWGGKLKSKGLRQNHRQQSAKQGRSGVILATAETGVETNLEPATGVKFAKQGVSPGEDDLELLGAGKAQDCGSIEASYCCQHS